MKLKKRVDIPQFDNSMQPSQLFLQFEKALELDAYHTKIPPNMVEHYALVKGKLLEALGDIPEDAARK